MQDFWWDDLNFFMFVFKQKNKKKIRQTIVVKNVKNTGPFNYQLLCSSQIREQMPGPEIS